MYFCSIFAFTNITIALVHAESFYLLRESYCAWNVFVLLGMYMSNLVKLFLKNSALSFVLFMSDNSHSSSCTLQLNNSNM
jgi:hypothetical protein